MKRIKVRRTDGIQTSDIWKNEIVKMQKTKIAYFIDITKIVIAN